MKAKAIFVPSLLLNVVLVAVGALGLRQFLVRSTSGVQVEPKAAATLSSTSKSASEMARGAVGEPFHWSQVESSDDAAYIRNLRAIGCPEATIRDILAAAVGRRYDKMREDLRARQAKGEIGMVALQDGVAKLWDEQNDLMARLFGTQASFGAGGLVAQASPGGVSASPAHPWVNRFNQPGPLIRSDETAPLVFVEPDPAWGLTDTELDVWYQVRDNFSEAIGGPDQDPTDPAYHARWKEAKAEADQRLKTLFGFAKFSQWQMQSRSQMPPPPAK